ncbi:MAG: ABC transporter ATP-binding protein [Rhodobacteraceae bacterium]|jgi:branched-chain amino acid transport system ATP-binding protein|nr:ABC transporter ATP-binding protein [Paracoccaceae bacterium]
MPEALLAIDGLDVFHGDFQALYGIAAEVAPGEMVAVIGANGAGKTTLLRAVAGLLGRRAAAIRWKGRPIGGMRADRVAALGIALVPEGRLLFPSLSIEENLLIGGRMGRRGPWDLAAVYRLFPILRERRGFAPAQLSGGQQQMAAIGRALMANPELILIDEISLGLAPVAIRQLYEVLPGIVGEGMAAVIVEQDTTRALAVTRRFYCLQEGRVALAGASGSVTREAIGRAYFGV